MTSARLTIRDTNRILTLPSVSADQESTLNTTTAPRSRRRRTRNLVRLAHLAGAGALGTYVYAPASVTDSMQVPIRLLGIPLLGLTGLYLWKPAWFRRPNPADAR